MIIKLKNPAALDLPPIRELFGRAFAKGVPVPAEVALKELAELIGSPLVHVLVGREGDRYDALAVVMFPSSPLFPLPQVYHFFNGGSQALRNRLTDAVVETIKAGGYNGLHAANWANIPDKVWARLFRRAGKVERIGSAFRIEFDGLRR